MPTYYDDALPNFAAIVRSKLGPEALIANLFLRDATGRVTFILTNEIAEDAKRAIADEAASIWPYVEDAAEAIATPEEMLDDTLEDPNSGRIEYLTHPGFTGFVRVVERRIVGSDWLAPPQQPIPDLPPVVVFASHKGGVGRSTALAVTAADFAASNLNVLTVDLDLEAPGIGGMLLENGSRPEFGALDFFVENGLQNLGIDFLRSIVGTSKLAAGQGLIHVVPANGARSQVHPQNVLGKLSRAYLDDPQDSDLGKSFLSQTRDLLTAISSLEHYDAILVDVRAGLNESTAAAIMGLGADVLLFGVSTPQTFEGYRYLLSHLGAFKPDVGAQDDWRYRLKMIQAKAPASSEALRKFRYSSFELFAEMLYDLDDSGDAFNFDIDDHLAPHYPWLILNDSNYLEFDPLASPDQLGSSLYKRTFGEFLGGLRDRIGLTKNHNAPA